MNDCELGALVAQLRGVRQWCEAIDEFLDLLDLRFAQVKKWLSHVAAGNILKPPDLQTDS